jgi:serine/threonine protein kinase
MTQKEVNNFESLLGALMPLFVTVTSYEGVSLQCLIKKQGYLSLNVRVAAIASLKRIHEAGVVHGDIALRNVVFRERDQKVLWVDFEMSHVRTPEDDDEKIRAAIQGEMEELQTVLRDIPLEPPPKQSLTMIPGGDTSSAMATTNNNNTSSNHTSSSSQNGGTRKRTKISPYHCCCG